MCVFCVHLFSCYSSPDTQAGSLFSQVAKGCLIKHKDKKPCLYGRPHMLFNALSILLSSGVCVYLPDDVVLLKTFVLPFTVYSFGNSGRTVKVSCNQEMFVFIDRAKKGGNRAIQDTNDDLLGYITIHM